ncbi:MAG: hypothetical protein R2710_20310 [Acidimicrobiales bacterium]
MRCVHRHCPVHVDIPELSHGSSRRTTQIGGDRCHHVLSRFESLVPLVQRLPAGTRRSPDWRQGRLGLVDLPDVPARPAATLPTCDPDDVDVDVVVLADVFTSVLDREEAVAAVALLEAVGYSVAVSRLVPTAKFDHVKGLRRRFARAASAQRELLDQIEEAGAVAVSLDPAIALMHRHDYAKVDTTYPRHAVRPLIDLLVDRMDRLPPAAQPRSLHLFGHCTEQALAPAWIDGWTRVLGAVGHDVQRVSTGCCGMAGIFGHEAENADMSHALFDQLWRPHLDTGAAAGSGAVATGWSPVPGQTP